MKPFEFTEGASEFFRINQFIALGNTEEISKSENQTILTEKFDKERMEKPSFAWGTLGWSDNRPFLPTGKLVYSEEGNDREGIHDGIINANTVEHVRDLKELNDSLDEGNKVWERTLNFDEVNFELNDTFTMDELPELRLSLFLDEDEGAVVYYQHSKKGDYNDDDAPIEYIQCQRTDEDFSGKRDRLSYFFPIIPKKLLEVEDKESEIFRLTDEVNPNSFIVKILTFKRKPLNPETFLKDITKTLSNNAKQKAFDLAEGILYEKVGKKKYRFMVFDPNVNRTYLHKKKAYTMGGDFIRVRNNGQVKNNLKTLFLIHGTFVTTIKSYLDVWRIYDGETTSYLQNILRSGRYEQIIALDHPTISAGAQDNVDYLKRQLQQFGISFDHDVDVITTSRGAVVAECLSGDSDLAQSMRLNKVMMFSAANGSGYFRTGKYISKGLSIWKKSVSGPAAKVILAIVQMSADFFLQLPGCTDMTPRAMSNSTLGPILSLQPNNPATEYKNIIADWNKSLEDNFLRKLWKTPTDFAIKIALGWRHDWVIGCKKQKIVPDHSQDQKAPCLDVRSIHGGYLDKNYVQDKNGKGIDRGFDIHAEITQYLP